MNKIITAVISLLLVSMTLGAQESDNTFRDASFAGGFSVICPDMAADTICGLLKVDSTKTPVWTLRQYNSKYNMASAKRTEGLNKYTFTLPGNGNLNAKVVTVNPSRNSLCLECNASAEYTGIRRKDQPWISLTVDAPTDSLLLAKYKKMPLYIACRAVSYEDCMGFLANKEIHAAICRFNFKLRNINRSGKAFGKCFTVSILLFDNRQMGALADARIRPANTPSEGEFVYTPSTKSYISSSLSNYRLPKPRQSAEVSCDLLSIVKEALDVALAKGLFEETYLAEWELVACDYGWEMTGTYNAAFEIKDIKLNALR